jgi:hypothetical protein
MLKQRRKILHTDSKNAQDIIQIRSQSRDFFFGGEQYIRVAQLRLRLELVLNKLGLFNLTIPFFFSVTHFFFKKKLKDKGRIPAIPSNQLNNYINPIRQ